MKKIIIFMLFLSTFSFGKSIDKLYEQSDILISKIEEMERYSMIELYNELEITCVEEKKISYIEKVKAQDNFSFTTLPSNLYIDLVAENGIENLEFLTKLSIIALDDSQFNLLIESGVLKAVLGDGVVIDLIASYEEIEEFIENIIKEMEF